jgi:hypothetical protein
MSEAFAQAKAAGVPGIAYEPNCHGCAPRECRDGSLICDRCFGRMKSLLHDAPDLLGRLRAMADPASSSWNWDKPEPVASSSTVAPAPIPDDLADAIIAVEGALEGWLAWNGDLQWISNNLAAVTWLSARVLDAHPPVEGIRESWSVLDAVRRWGIERRANGAFVYPVDEEERAEIVEPVSEWFDPLITVKQAAERHKVTQQAVRKWIADGHLVPATKTRGPRGSVMWWVYTTAVDAVATRAGA